MKIKFKVLAGFILIIAMLIVAGFMSIYEFMRLGKSVNALIEDNYKTIEASKTMLEALEREDSGILLLFSGHWKEGRSILLSGDSAFNKAFKVAKNNITEKDEDKRIEKISGSYNQFKKNWDIPIVGTDKEQNFEWYFNVIHKQFLIVKHDVKLLMELNQESLYIESTKLKEQSRRAIMPGIVAIVSALVFLIIFNFFISKYFIKPIESLIYSVKHFNSYNNTFNAGIVSNDEFKELETEIQNLIYKLSQIRKS
jgi:methyl-accepting chemotaxis protein